MPVRGDVSGRRRRRAADRQGGAGRAMASETTRSRRPGRATAGRRGMQITRRTNPRGCTTKPCRCAPSCRISVGMSRLGAGIDAVRSAPAGTIVFGALRSFIGVLLGPSWAARNLFKIPRVRRLFLRRHQRNSVIAPPIKQATTWRSWLPPTARKSTSGVSAMRAGASQRSRTCSSPPLMAEAHTFK